MGIEGSPAGRWTAATLVLGLLLAATVGVTSAAAHPGHAHGKGSGEPAGIGVQVDAPTDLAGFYSAVQWGDTGPIEDQAGRLVFAGTGCSPANYVPIAGEVDGNVALIVGGENPADPADQCPAATFVQKVRSAEAAGAIGLVQIPAEGAEPAANATAVDASIPALEVHRTDEVLELLDAVLEDVVVEATLTDTYEPIELDERISDAACVDGRAAGIFDCDRIDLLSFVPAGEFDGAGQSDLWGWTDEETGDEYVMIGKTNGVAFFRVTDPTDPVYLGELPNPGVLEEIWHDIKVYEDHAFIVSESEPHGMSVFDLTRLREATEPEEYDRDAWYPLTSAAHNVEINTETGYAYIVGGNAGIVVPDVCLSGLHMVDISDPTSPTPAGCYFEEGGPGTAARSVGEPVESASPAAYVHDTQCVVYDGPDERYTGQEVCFNSAEDKVVIADVTDKMSPQTLGWTDYPHVAYTHQGWLTEDHRYLIVNDELDELNEEEIENTRTVIIDVSDLENPVFHAEHIHETRSITHNNYVVGDLVYQSNYTSGLRVLDVTPLYDEEPGLEEVAYFDTFPTHGDPTFEGTWSNYPYFGSGTIAVSGIDEGLFLLALSDGEPGDDDDDGQAPGEDEAGVEVGCAGCPLEVRAGESGSVEIEVTNTGDGDDAYRLEVDEVPDGWAASLQPETVAASAGESATSVLSVEVPRQERAGSHRLTVTATSGADGEVSDATDVEVVVTKGRPSDAGPPEGNGPQSQSQAPDDGGDGAAIATRPASATTDPTVPAALGAALLAGLLAAPALRRHLTG